MNGLTINTNLQSCQDFFDNAYTKGLFFMLTQAYYLTFDIGGTTIKYGLIDENLSLIHLGQLETHQNQNGMIIQQLIQTTRKVMTTHKIIGIGVSTAGIVNRELGTIIYAGPTIPNYIGTEIKAIISHEFELPVYVENDVNAALLGEKLVGAAQDANNIYCVALGTGIGGAHLLNDHLQDGGTAQANSIGYLLYDSATQTNYEQRASTLTLQAQLSAQLHLSVPEAFDAAKRGESLPLEIIKNWSRSVAQGLAQIILIVDPELLIIGGGVSKQEKFLLDLLNQCIPAYLPPNFYRTKLVTAHNFNDAALFGAVYRFFN